MLNLIEKFKITILHLNNNRGPHLGKKFWSPLCDPQRIVVPPLTHSKKLVPPLTTSENSGPPPPQTGAPLPLKNDSSLTRSELAVSHSKPVEISRNPCGLRL